MKFATLQIDSNSGSETFTLEYWVDDGVFVGKLQELPSVFSQGKSYEELVDNIREVYRMVTEEDDVENGRGHVKIIFKIGDHEIEIEEDVFKGLVELAEKEGVSLEKYVAKVLEKVAKEFAKEATE